ncbi:MAG: hypothetical protein ACK5V3_11900, partial [Bdellovibrionales bacterium]
SEREYKSIAYLVARGQMLRIAELEARIKESESFFKDKPTLSNAARDALITASGSAISFFAYAADKRSYVVKKSLTLRGSAGAIAVGALGGIFVSATFLDSFARDQRSKLMSMTESESITDYLGLQTEHKAQTESVLRKIQEINLTPSKVN